MKSSILNQFDHDKLNALKKEFTQLDLNLNNLLTQDELFYYLDVKVIYTR